MTTSSKGPDEKYALRSVSRALDVLDTLGGASQGMGVGEVAEAVGISRSTAFTLLQTLMARGFVADQRIGSSRLYRLGLSLVHLGDHALQELGITQVTTPVLQELTNATKLTSRLAILDDGCAVIIGRVDAPGPFRMIASLGRRELPHSSALGKALLSSLPDNEIVALVKRLGMPPRTDYTLTRPDALLRDLREVRARGYALDNEEDSAGVICVGSTIRNRASETVAAISVTTMRLSPTECDIHALGATVRAYADRASLLLGGPVHAALSGKPVLQTRNRA